MASREEKLAELRRLDKLAQLRALDAQQPAPPEDVDFDAMTMLKNVPGSAYRMGEQLYTAATNPIDTARAVGGLGRALANKVGRKTAELVTGQEFEASPDRSEAAADAAWEALKARYGSVDAFQQTLMDDPVGVMVDLSAAGTATRVPVLARAAAAADPVNLAVNTGRTAAKAAIPKNLPRSLYKRANKIQFHPSMSRVDQQAALQAGLDTGVRATPRGAAELGEIIKPLSEQAGRLVDDASKAGRLVDAGGVFKYLDELKAKKGGVKVEGKKDLKKIDKIEKEFREQLGGRTQITPREMQDFKTDAYSKIYDTTTGKKKKQITADTYTTLGRGAKETLEAELPEIAAINAKLGPLLNLQRPLEKSARRIPSDYGNLMRATGPAIAGAGATMLGGPKVGFAVAGATGAAMSPLARSKMAVALNKIKNNDVGWLQNNLTATELRQAMILAGRTEELQEDEE